MYTGKPIGQIVLRQHDLLDACEILRLMLLYPQHLRCGKSGKRDICRVLGKLFLSDHIIQIVRLLRGASVIPQNCRADHLIVLIQNDKPVHLPAKADTSKLALIAALEQFLQSGDRLLIPVLRFLLRPARMRKIKRIFF